MRTDGSPESNRAVIDWTRDSETRAYMDENGAGEDQLSINTLEGAHWVTPGDYVVRGVKGEHYPVKPDIFHATYDPAAQAEEAANAVDRAEALPARVRSMLAAEFAAMGALGIGLIRCEFKPELYDILDQSPDIPASALLQFMAAEGFDFPVVSAEALRATYVGLAPWVKAEGERILAEAEAARPKAASRYEKHGKEERVGAKIVDQAEKDRIARNQAGEAYRATVAGDVTDEP